MGGASHEEVGMGSVVPRSAGTERIFEDFGEARDNGRRRAVAVKDTVETRLGPIEVGVNAAKAEHEADKAALEEADKALLVIDSASDLEVGAVIDEMWNALGRPASSIEHTLIVGRGKAQWTDGKPAEQPTLMTILASGIRRTTAPALQAGRAASRQGGLGSAHRRPDRAASAGRRGGEEGGGQARCLRGHRPRRGRSGPGGFGPAEAGSAEHRPDRGADSRDHPQPPADPARPRQGW